MKTWISTVKISAVILVIAALFFSCSLKIVGPEEYGTLVIDIPGSESAARTTGWADDKVEKLFEDFLKNVKYRVVLTGPTGVNKDFSKEQLHNSIRVKSGRYNIKITAINAADVAISDPWEKDIDIVAGDKSTVTVELKLETGGCELIDFSLKIDNKTYKGLISKNDPGNPNDDEIIFSLPPGVDEKSDAEWTFAHTGAKIRIIDESNPTVDKSDGKTKMPLAELRKYKINVYPANGELPTSYSLSTSLSRLASKSIGSLAGSVTYYSLYVEKNYEYEVEFAFEIISPLEVTVQKITGLNLALTTVDGTAKIITTSDPKLTFTAKNTGVVYIEVKNAAEVRYRIKYNSNGGPALNPAPSIDIQYISAIPVGYILGEIGVPTHYVVDTDLTVTGKTLLIRPGTTIEFMSGTGITVEYGGSIKIEGTDVLEDADGHPYTDSSGNSIPGLGNVILQSDGSGWNGLYIEDSKVDINYCTIEDAGKGIYLVGYGSELTKMDNTIINNCDTGIYLDYGSVLKVLDHTTIQGNGALSSTGIYLDGGKLNSIKNTTIQNYDYVIYTYNIYALHDITSQDNTFSSTFSKNYIYVDSDYIGTNMTMKNIGIPWFLEDGLYIDNSVMTIEPGTEIWIGAGGNSIYVEYNSTLVANGTAAEPIVFRGVNATPGYWRGINVYSDSPGTIFSNCEISDCGHNPGYDNWYDSYGCLKVYWGAYAELQNVTISNSAFYGIGIYTDTATPTDNAQIKYGIASDVTFNPSSGNNVYIWDDSTGIGTLQATMPPSAIF